MISFSNFQGNPYIGVYCAASNKHAFAPMCSDDVLLDKLRESLSVEVIKLSIGGATIVGSLIAMNSHGVIVSNIASEEEIAMIPKELSVAKMQDDVNATGNNILVTDKAAMVHPGVTRETLQTLSDVFEVEVVRGTIADIATVGSVAVATGKGLICHPRATEDNIATLKELFSVPVTLATLNYGTPWLGACVVANDRGAVVGEKTTPIELGKLEDGLLLY
jgi:translation initiation factor 6